MTDADKLAIVRGVHGAIFIAMVTSVFVVVYAGASGSVGPWLWLPLGLLGIESAVLLVNGMRCPLTALAIRYGAEKGYTFDTYLPERVARHTFWFFGSLMFLGVSLLAARWLGWLG
jgi:hypothetical protein